YRAHLGARAQLVLVVVVEQVHRPGAELVHLSGAQVAQLALTGHAEHGLDVVGVPGLVDGASRQSRLVYREAHAVVGQAAVPGAPVVGDDVRVRAGDLVDRAHDHAETSCVGAG